MTYKQTQPLLKRDKDYKKFDEMYTSVIELKTLFKQTLPVIKEVADTVHGINGNIGLVAEVNNSKKWESNHDDRHDKNKVIMWKIIGLIIALVTLLLAVSKLV